MSESVQFLSHILKKQGFALLLTFFSFLPASHTGELIFSLREESNTPGMAEKNPQKKPGSLITPWRRAVTAELNLYMGEK